MNLRPKNKNIIPNLNLTLATTPHISHFAPTSTQTQHDIYTHTQITAHYNLRKSNHKFGYIETDTRMQKLYTKLEGNGEQVTVTVNTEESHQSTVSGTQHIFHTYSLFFKYIFQFHNWNIAIFHFFFFFFDGSAAFCGKEMGKIDRMVEI